MFVSMHVTVLRTPSLGDASYLVAHGGHGIVVDPQRDLGRMFEAIDEQGVTVTHVLDTHIHNDYLSGARALARHLHADLVLPAAAGAGFPFVAAFHLEDLAGESGMTIRPLHTPGHTPEHTSYLVLVDGRPEAVFSGGSLLVGSAGRPDLLGMHLADSLARLQYHSVQRLARLPGSVGLYPTHGAGSFCTVSRAGRDVSTIEHERRTNPVLAHRDEDSFVRGQLSGLLPYPDYYPNMAPINRSGPEPVDPTPPPRLDRPAYRELVSGGAAVIDARPRHAYAAGHQTGALNVELGNSFATWVGWLVPFGTPLVVVLDDDQDPAVAAVEMARIGYQVVGWTTADTPTETTSTRLAGIADLEAALDHHTVVDVRDPSEWGAGHLRRSVHRYVPELREDVPDGDGEVWLVCASGFRAGIAAGLVERGGGTPVVVASGGVSDLLAHRPDLAAV
jgi:glyoxylase-like metal-dependent hydrolase (beta-lactamase superfamily II)/rhodanese-related sulfurtransferase